MEFNISEEAIEFLKEEAKKEEDKDIRLFIRQKA